MTFMKARAATDV